SDLHRAQVHLTHQPPDVLAIDRVAAILQFIAYPPAAIERPLQVDLVNQSHQPQVQLVDRLGTVVCRRTCDPKQFAPPRLRQSVLHVYLRSAFTHRSRPSTLAKKSFSIASCPIFAWSFSTSRSLCWAWTAFPPNTSSAPSTRRFFQS